MIAAEKPTAKLNAWKFSAVRVMPRASSSASDSARTLAEASTISRTCRTASEGSAEASVREGRISSVSPVGAALMGRRVGDAVTILTPGGEIRYVVLEIE